MALILDAYAVDTGERFTTVAGISLDKTTISDIQKKLGPSKIVVTGDASLYDARISYDIRGGTIQFFQGEMNDGVGVCVTTDRSIKPCSPWPKNAPIPQVNIAGLQLGISEDQFRKVVNRPVQWRGYIATVHFEGRGWIDINGIFYNGRLIQFEIVKTTSDG
jgi:hypothetical protein